MKNIFILFGVVLFGCARPPVLTNDDFLPIEQIRGKVEFFKKINFTLNKEEIYDATQRFIISEFAHPKSVKLYENPITGKIYCHWSSYAYFNKKEGNIYYSVYFDISDNQVNLTISDICYGNAPYYNYKSIENYLIDEKIVKPLEKGNTAEYVTRVYLRKKIAKDVKTFISDYENLLKYKFENK